MANKKYKWPKSCKRYHLSLYGCTIYFINNKKDYLQALSYLHGKEEPITEVQTSSGKAVQMESEDGAQIFIIGVFDDKTTTLVHEAAHVAIFISEHVGFKAEDGNSEPFAYLIEDIYAHFESFLTNKEDNDIGN